LTKLYKDQFNYKEATEFYLKALKIMVEVGNREGEGVSYGNLAGVFQSLGKYGKAEEYHHKSLAIMKEIGDRQGEATVYGNLAWNSISASRVIWQG